MLTLTHLGHHGWLVQSGATAMLLDPLLLDGPGLLPLSGARLRPPRRVEAGALPPVDAVLLTREAPGHLDPASLALVARDVPIHLTVRSSRAARELLEGAGFAVHALEPGRPVTVGDLRALPLAAGPPTPDAPDGGGLALVVENWVEDATVVFTGAEPPGLDLKERVRARFPWPTVWVQPLVGSLDERAVDAEMGVATATEGVETAAVLQERTFGDWLSPELILLPEDGLRLRAPWPAGAGTPRDELSARLQGQPLAVAVPGTTVALQNGRVMAVEVRSDVVRRVEERPADALPDPEGGAVEALGPASGGRRLSDDERTRLDAALGTLARFAFGSELLCALDQAAAGPGWPDGVVPSFSFTVLEGDEPASRVLACRPWEARFVEVEGVEHALDLTLWGADLLAALERRALFQDLVRAGRVRQRCHPDAPAPLDLRRAIALYLHPARDPDAHLALYRAAAGPPDAEPVVQAPEVPPPERTWPSLDSEPGPGEMPVWTAFSGPKLHDDGAPDPDQPEAPRPVDVAALAPVVERATGGAWTVRSGEEEPGRLRVVATSATHEVTLTVTPGDAAERSYRTVEGLAFGYQGPPDATPGLDTVDRLIDALAPHLARPGAGPPPPE